ncbi:CbtA family protein [Pseudonocardia sp. RS010]|uniref:CbtA family protein n=1 Tax=Pseudonocardia sp. RS010 TaxID=3385979 RepID=UPI0039A1D6DC
MGPLLVRGMLTGAVAALAASVFAYLIGEGPLEGGIAYENGLAGTVGEDGGAELVTRGVQSTLGLGVALLVYGVVLGGIFALVYAAVHGRLGRTNPRATAGVLAGAGYVVIVLVPFLKYPSNPPASSVDATIGARTTGFVLMLALSAAVAVGAVVLGRGLARRIGAWNGVPLAALVYVVVVGVGGALLPSVAETPENFPPSVLYDFRVATLGIHLVLWTVVGLLFGALVDHDHAVPSVPSVAER